MKAFATDRWFSLRYAFSHIDFHFGSENSKGSEHSLDEEHFPLEMEIIFYDGQLRNMNEVQYSQEKDAIAILSFLFEVNLYILDIS